MHTEGSRLLLSFLLLLLPMALALSRAQIEWDCFGHGNQGMTHMYNVILREKMGKDGLVNFRHTHILKANEAGLLTEVAFHVLNKTPIKGDGERSVGRHAKCVYLRNQT